MRGLAAALLAVVVVGCVTSRPGEVGQNPDVRRLARILGDHRVIRPRLTGGFAHADCPTSEESERLISGLICGGSVIPPRTATRLQQFATQMRAGTARVATGDSRHAVGVFSLLWPDVDGSVETAVTQFQAAAVTDSANATVLSDWAAALLIRAEIGDNPPDLIEALSAANRAIALDSSLDEARFNRALALEFLYLITDAVSAWEDYLDLDTASPWAKEARAHLDALNESLARGSWQQQRDGLAAAIGTGDPSAVDQIVSSFRGPVRRHVLQEIFPGWARARVSGAMREADSMLTLGRALGNAFLRVTGDMFLADAVRAIDMAKDEDDDVRLAALVAGQLALVPGTELYNPAEAQRVLAQARSPLGEQAAYVAALDAYQQYAYERSLRLLAGIENRVSADRYPVLRAQVAHMQGLIHEIRAAFASALTSRRLALEFARSVGDRAFAARQHADLAGLSALLIDEREAWAHRFEALRSAPAIVDPTQRLVVYTDIAADVIARVPADVALLFQGEVVRAARLLDDPQSIAEALLSRAELYDQSGRHALALSDLEDAAGHVADVANDLVRREREADLLLVSGEVFGRHNPERALDALATAASYFERTEYYYRLARSRLASARAYLRLDRYDQADSAFSAAIRETERQRGSLESHAQRAQFLDRARSVFDEMVAFQVARGEVERAFDFFERTRARVLLERVSSAGADSSSTQELRRRLPAGVTLVSYAVLEHELFIWMMDREQLRLQTVPLPSRELEQLVSRLQSSILNPEAANEFRSVAGRLYQSIVAPVLATVRPDSRLIFIPDKWLHFVPFAALWNEEQERFLIEDYELNMAPSAGLFVWASERYSALAADTLMKVLAVGNPSFDRREFRLPDLPHAKAEAERVAASWRGTTVLLGPAATKRAFLSRGQASDVIHFAGHAVVRPEAPLRSHLVLAADPDHGETGALYAEDLFTWRLPRTRLVILSGCHTSSGRLSDTEGASSLARAFFATGVPAVVASFWAVDDERTADLFATFHQRLAGGIDAVAALRAAQLELIEASRSGVEAVSAWAAFQLIGSTVE